MKDLADRIKYNFFVLFLVDGTWDMGADLCFSWFPLGGKWVNENGIFDTLEQALRPMEEINEQSAD